MTSKNLLSDKKNVKISFSTSPALTDWIKRHVIKQRSDNPKDERYRSISSFIHFCLDYLMKIFEKGKSLEDFDRFVDKNINDFYDQITFKAIIPHMEEAIEMHKYITPSKGLMSYFRAFRKAFFQGMKIENFLENFDKNSKIIIERFEKFIQQNNITNKLTFEKSKNLYIIEFTGIYRNLHYEFSKEFAAIIGIVGLKILDTTYIADNSINYFYTRFDCIPTELLKQVKPKLNEQIVLGLENIQTMIKYEQIIADKTEHVWLNTSNFKGAIISFSNIQTGVKYIRSKIKEMEKTVDRTDLPYNILHIFEHFHWITIDNLDPLSCHYIISNEEHQIDHAIMEEILTEFLDKNIESDESFIIK